MPSKAELAQLLDELEEEYRFWAVEAISLDRGIENLEEKIEQHEEQLGPARDVFVVPSRRSNSKVERFQRLK